MIHAFPALLIAISTWVLTRAWYRERAQREADERAWRFLCLRPDEVERWREELGAR